MQQFVIEAASTSALGGVTGILLGDLLSVAASVVATRLMGENLSVSPTLAAVAAAFGISVGIGILFGYLPAKKAAVLNPIDALHYDLNDERRDHFETAISFAAYRPVPGPVPGGAGPGSRRGHPAGDHPGPGHPVRRRERKPEPEQPVTRAEFVKMMTAASTYQDAVGTGQGASLFTDVKSGYWANGYIQLAVEQEWVTGYVDGSFRPGSSITLEEACTALLRLLGFDSGSLSGSFPEAQLSKARSLGLLDDLDVSQGETLTRQDCVTLFYNLLVSENSEGTVYGTTLGYTVTNGEVDYSTLVTADTKGPYVADSGSLSLPFSTSGITVYRNGTASELSAVQQYDVYYYNENLRTVWIYSDRVTGTPHRRLPRHDGPHLRHRGGGHL